MAKRALVVYGTIAPDDTHFEVFSEMSDAINRYATLYADPNIDQAIVYSAEIVTVFRKTSTEVNNNGNEQQREQPRDKPNRSAG